MPGITVVYCVQALREYSKGSILFVNSGVDPDRFLSRVLLIRRDIARYCLRFDAYALTSDSDFLVYPIKGMVDLRPIIDNFQFESIFIISHSSPALHLVPKRVEVYTLHSILSALKLPYEAFLFVILLQGNDYVHGVSLERIKASNQKQTLGALFDYARSLHGSDARFLRQSLRLAQPAALRRRSTVSCFPLS